METLTARILLPAWAGAIVSFVFTLLISLGAVGVLWQLRLAWASRRWPRVHGKVIRSEVDSPGDQPEIEYSYLVDGVERIGKKVSYHEVHGTGLSEGLVRRYPAGTRVEVSYDPAQPGRAVLEPGATSLNYVLVGILVPAALLLIAWWGLEVFRWVGS